MGWTDLRVQRNLRWKVRTCTLSAKFLPFMVRGVISIAKTLFLMLNGHLRIQLMQASLLQPMQGRADLLLAHDLIEERFRPDLNSMEVQGTKNCCDRIKKSALPTFRKRMMERNPHMMIRSIQGP